MEDQLYLELTPEVKLEPMEGEVVLDYSIKHELTEPEDVNIKEEPIETEDVNIKEEPIETEDVKINEEPMDIEDVKIEPEIIFHNETRYPNLPPIVKIEPEVGRSCRVDSEINSRVSYYVSESMFDYLIDRHNRILGQVENYRSTECYKCEICTKTYKLRVNYRKHMLRHENGLIPLDKMCDICKKMIKPNNVYHAKYVHTKERPFQCKRCEANFKTPIALKSHMKTHSR